MFLAKKDLHLMEKKGIGVKYINVTKTCMKESFTNVRTVVGDIEEILITVSATPGIISLGCPSC